MNISRSIVLVLVIFLLTGFTVLLAELHPSMGQQGLPATNRFEACGCFCGFEPPYPPVPPDPYRIFNVEPCTGILAADACSVRLSSLPADEMTRVCEKVKGTRNFKSFKESCPVFAKYCEPAKDPPKDKCDKKRACDALKAIGELIAKYQGSAGYFFGSFAEFNQKLGPLVQELSEALACRFNKDHPEKDAAVLNDFIGQILRDRNGFKTVTPRSQVPHVDACQNATYGLPVGPACDDYKAIDRIRSNAEVLAAAIGCEAPPRDVPPAKKDCEELANGVLDGLTNFFESVKEVKSRTSPGSGDAYDQVADGFKSAIQELEAAAREIEGTGGTGAQQYKDIQEKISKLKRLLDVWAQIKAASCLPPDIEQLLRKLATEKKAGSEHKATCTELCAATADWYVKVTGLSAQRSPFFKACTLACF